MCVLKNFRQFSEKVRVFSRICLYTTPSYPDQFQLKLKPTFECIKNELHVLIMVSRTFDASHARPVAAQFIRAHISIFLFFSPARTYLSMHCRMGAIEGKGRFRMLDFPEFRARTSIGPRANRGTPLSSGLYVRGPGEKESGPGRPVPCGKLHFLRLKNHLRRMSRHNASLSVARCDCETF